MNVVYLLTNVSKIDFPKYYIGSKLECDLIKVNDIDSIIDRKKGRVYYGSSSCPIMQEDLRRGDTFVAEVLEVSTRDKIRHIEDVWLKEFNVSESKFFYNKSDDAFIRSLNPQAVSNKYGETSAQIAKSYSSMGKRNATAKALGFNNAFDLAMFIINNYLISKNWATVSALLNKHRHFSVVYVRNTNIEKLLLEDPREYSSCCYEMFMERATIECIANKYNLEIFTVIKALSLKDKYNTQVARRFNLSEDDLGKLICIEVLKGKSMFAIGSMFNLDPRVVNKIFIRFFRRRFKANDFK